MIFFFFLLSFNLRKYGDSVGNYSFRGMKNSEKCSVYTDISPRIHHWHMSRLQC